MKYTAPIAFATALIMASTVQVFGAEPIAEELGPMPDSKTISQVIVSLDCQNVGMIVQSSPQHHAILLNGHTKLETQEDIPFLAFSADGQHVAHIQDTATQSRVFIDDQPGSPYDHWRNTPGGLLLSPDARHIAYVAQKGKDWFVVWNGKEGPAGDASPTQISMSQDGQHLAYVLDKGKSKFVVSDGVVSQPYVVVRDLCLSVDGRHAAYAESPGLNQWFAILDSKASGPYLDMQRLQISRDGLRWAFVAKTIHDPPFEVFIDGKSSDHFYEVAAGPVFSADGKHVAFNARTTNNIQYNAGVAVFDGTVTPAPHMIDLIYSPDGSRVAYTENYNSSGVGFIFDSFRLVVDDKDAGLTCDSAGGIVFSDDSRHVGCALQLRDVVSGWQIYLDGKLGAIHPSVAPPIFSNDGKHHAYAAFNKNGNWIVVLDEVELAQFELLRPTVDGGPNGHWKTVETVENRVKKMKNAGGLSWQGSVEGFHPEDFAVAQVPYCFDKSGTLHFLALRNGKILRVQCAN